MAEPTSDRYTVCGQLIPSGIFEGFNPQPIPGVGKDTTLEQVSAEIFKGDEGDYTPEKLISVTTSRIDIPTWIFQKGAPPMLGLFSDEKLVKLKEQSAKATQLIIQNDGKDCNPDKPEECHPRSFSFTKDGRTPADADGLSDEDRKLVAHYLALASAQGRCIESAAATAQVHDAYNEGMAEAGRQGKELIRLVSLVVIAYFAYFFGKFRGAKAGRAKGPDCIKPLPSKALPGGRTAGLLLAISKRLRWIGPLRNWARHTEGMRRLAQAEHVVEANMARLAEVQVMARGKKQLIPARYEEQVVEARMQANRIRKELGLQELGIDGKPLKGGRGTRRRK